MSWYPTDNRTPSAPHPAVATRPFLGTPTSSTLGRMPLTPVYPVPVEAEIVQRADFLHVMLRATLGANFLAPVSNPAYILDVGCGGGRWVREVASEHQGARVVGLDSTPPSESSPAISNVFDRTASSPLRYAFVQHNALEPLTFASASFDLTHMRLMMGVLPVAAWPQVVGELARVTKPGGWVELVEGDLIQHGGPALETMQRWALQVMLPQGLDPRLSSQLADLLRTRSLSDIQTHTVRLPIGPHGGRFGELMGNDLMARVEGLRMHTLSARLATPGQFSLAQEALRREMARMEYIQPYYVVYGRR
jgi:SAM-dependent methyltransferase